MKETVADCIQGWVCSQHSKTTQWWRAWTLNQGFGVQPLPPSISLCLSFPIQKMRSVPVPSLRIDWRIK